MGENQPNTCLGPLGLPALIKLGLDPGGSLTCLGVLSPLWASVSPPQLCVPDSELEDLLADQAWRGIAGVCAQHWGIMVAISTSTIPSHTQDALGMLELGCCSLSPQGFPSISVSLLNKCLFRPLALKHWVKCLVACLGLRQGLRWPQLPCVAGRDLQFLILPPPPPECRHWRYASPRQGWTCW